MFRFLVLALASALIFTSSAFADLYEIASVDQISPFVTEDSLVLWDLDKTIMVFDWQAPHAAQLVENQIPKIISDLQARGIRTLAITRRKPQLLANTQSELQKFGIDFTKTAPQIKEPNFAPGMLYQSGVIFTSEQEKGEALKPFLSQADFKSVRVMLIDDEWFNVVSLAQATEKLNLGFDGFYYRQADIQNHTIKNLPPITTVKIGDFPIETHRNLPPKDIPVQNSTASFFSSCSDLFE